MTHPVDPSLPHGFGASAPREAPSAAALFELREDFFAIRDAITSLELVSTLIDPVAQPGGYAVGVDRAQMGAFLRTVNGVLDARMTSAEQRVLGAQR